MTIKATIIADSINEKGDRFTTFEMEYPRFIHSEVMTHRMLSKNAASSRAIPITAMHENIRNDPGMPIYWGKNQSGMQAKEELSEADIVDVKDSWFYAQDDALFWSKKLAEKGLHKQLANRVTEAYQTMKIVISGTEWANFFWLRDHPDAQPEFKRLAEVTKEAMDISIPMPLEFGEWHLPYIQVRRPAGVVSYYTSGAELSLEDAKILSVSQCAQVSYRKTDDTIEKAKMIYDRLVTAEVMHASPFEHQGTPIPDLIGFEVWPQGITHQRRDRTLWSGNLQGFIQYRQLIPNNTRW